LSIFKTGSRAGDGNPNVYALCDAYYDPWKIDIPCDPNRGVPSAVPSISLRPTSSSPPTTSSPPSLSPSSSSFPTITPDCSCGFGEFKFELELRTDRFPGETSWKIEDWDGVILHSESGYNEQLTIFNHEYCLPVGCYDFVIDDFWWDGICCGKGDGYYEGSIYGWKEILIGGDFEFQAIEHFCGEDVCPFATHYPSTSPSASPRPSISPSSAPTLPPDCSCGVGEFKFELELRTDWFPGETSWKIEDWDGVILHSESGYNEQFTIFNYEYCLPVGCYDFVIDDSAGEGICCDRNSGDGYYRGSIYGWKEILIGGDFEFQAIEHFCGEDVCPFATHYPSTSPSASPRPSTSPSSRPSISTNLVNIETSTWTVLSFIQSIVTFFNNLLPF